MQNNGRNPKIFYLQFIAKQLVIEIYLFELSNQPTKIVIFLQNLNQNSGF